MCAIVAVVTHEELLVSRIVPAFRCSKAIGMQFVRTFQSLFSSSLCVCPSRCTSINLCVEIYTCKQQPCSIFVHTVLVDTLLWKIFNQVFQILNQPLIHLRTCFEFRQFRTLFLIERNQVEHIQKIPRVKCSQEAHLSTLLDGFLVC